MLEVALWEEVEKVQFINMEFISKIIDRAYYRSQLY